jgi:O-antigen/teichoic acid export membrane protein
MLTGAPLLARELAQSEHQADVITAFRWMALAMPAIVLTAGYRGILEAMGRFGIINIIRLPMGIFTYAGPLVAVWVGYRDLATISAVLCIGRILACGLHAVFAFRALPSDTGHGRFNRSLAGPMLQMGGWMSVSNIVSPLMNYVDRFLIGFAISAAAVAYYATPQELVLRIGIIPTAIAAVLFPMFAAQLADGSDGDWATPVRRYSLVILELLLPFTILLILLAGPFLRWWVSPDFAAQSTLVLQIMALSALFSGLAQVPFTLLQGRGRADVTAKLHLAELPIYLCVLYWLVTQYGVTGAAIAWMIRIGGDMAMMYLLCWRCFGTKPKL